MSKIFLLVVILTLGVIIISCSSKSIPSEKSLLSEKLSEESTGPLVEPWQKDWGKTLVLSKKEGKVIVYLEASDAPAKEPLMRAIREKFGLEAEILVLLSGELNSRVLTERRAGLFYNDIIITGGGSMVNTLIPAGVFGSLEATFILPEVKEEKNWRGGKLPWFDSKKTVLRTLSLVREGATINNLIVRKEDFKSYKNMLDPQWKGRIIMHDPTIPGKGLGVFQLIEKIMGEDYLRQLARQEVLLTRDHRQLAEWLSRGKYAIGIAAAEAFTGEMQAIGAPLDFVEFMEGSGLGTGASQIGIMDQPPHPDAAKVFTNWFLSREGQTVFSIPVKYISRRIDVPTGHVNPIYIPKPGVKYVDDTEEMYKAWPEAMKLASEIFGIR